VKGNLFVVAAPSGAGKTTLVKALVNALDNITVSISHTTRLKRPDEVDGINYHFVSKNTFEDMIKNHAFLEHATIFDNYYGTSQQWVKDTLDQGIDVILEIDWQGHHQIKQLFPESLGIFILPPSLADLRDRLTKRNQDHPEVIEQRLADAKKTLSHIHEFNYVVVNDDFNHALSDLQAIVKAARLLQPHQTSRFENLINKFSELP